MYHNQQAGLTFLHQHRYIQQTLERFGMLDSYSVSTPADPNVTLSLTTDPSEHTQPLDVPYKEAIGCSIIFHCLHDQISLRNLDKIHWTTVKRIFRYLRGTPDLGLLYKRTPSTPQLQGYTLRQTINLLISWQRLYPGTDLKDLDVACKWSPLQNFKLHQTLSQHSCYTSDLYILHIYLQNWFATTRVSNNDTPKS